MVPDPETQNILQSEIDRLSATYNTPAFFPHITVGKLPEHSIKNAGVVLRQIVMSIKHHEIFFGNTVAGNSPYQKLTVEVDPSPLFTELKSDISDLFGNNFNKDEYHASLMYGQIPTQNLTQETERSVLKSRQNSFAHKLVAVDISGEPKEWIPVATEEFKSSRN